MCKKKLVKKLLIASMPVVMALSAGSLVYANTYRFAGNFL